MSTGCINPRSSWLISCVCCPISFLFSHCFSLLPFFTTQPLDQQQQVIRELYSAISKRPENVCNFLEGGSIYPKEFKIIYRHYATLYFIFIVDAGESELGILDLIQVFVETLDKCFENVCELDLIFHSDKVHYILDEIIMGGMVLETNLQEVIRTLEAMSKQEQIPIRVASSSRPTLADGRKF